MRLAREQRGGRGEGGGVGEREFLPSKDGIHLFDDIAPGRFDAVNAQEGCNVVGFQSVWVDCVLLVPEGGEADAFDC